MMAVVIAVPVMRELRGIERRDKGPARCGFTVRAAGVAGGMASPPGVGSSMIRTVVRRRPTPRVRRKSNS